MVKGGHWILWVSAARHETDWLLGHYRSILPITPSLSFLFFLSKPGGRPNIHFSTNSTWGGMSSSKYSCQHLMLLHRYALGKSQWISFQASLRCPREAGHACPTAVPPNPTHSTEGQLMVTREHCIPSSLSGAFSILQWQVWHTWLPPLWTIKLLWI